MMKRSQRKKTGGSGLRKALALVLCAATLLPFLLSGAASLTAEAAENEHAVYCGEEAVTSVSLPQDGTLAMGLTCEVRVNRESAMDATTVSMDAIQYDDNGKPFVYCYDRNGDVVEQSVLLGINNGTIVEIKDGVRTGETVLIPPTDMVLPMMRMMNR